MTQCVGFPPVSRHDARVLILGSLPGAESLRQQQYYAYKANSFWRIMGEIAGARPELPYPERLQRLMAHRIALWDVCAAAEREGSLDSAIADASICANDFVAFFNQHPSVKMICFNGQPAAKLFARKVLDSLPALLQQLRREVLPSTSPAHASLRFEQKLQKWRDVLGVLAAEHVT